MSTLSSVLLPLPVLPAMSACCATPRPSLNDCIRAAPVRPTGTCRSRALFSDQISPSFGIIGSNANSTRFASRAAAPTLCTSSVICRSDGATSTVSSTRPNVSSRHWIRPSSIISVSQCRDTSSRYEPPPATSLRVSCATSTCTPQRGPLAAMLANRRNDSSPNPAGRSATTTNRYGSASSPAWAL